MTSILSTLRSYPLLFLKGIVVLAISNIICLIVASVPFILEEPLNLDAGDYLLYGILAGIFCEWLGRNHFNFSDDPHKKAWHFMWRSVYCFFLVSDLAVLVPLYL